MYFQGFPAILQGVEKGHRTASARVRNRAGPGRFRTWFWVLALSALPACKENLSVPFPSGAGQDTTGPLVLLFPAHDTLADSTGTLLVRVDARDRSGVKTIDFFLIPARYTYNTITPNDTAFDGLYAITLAGFKHATFKYYVRASDFLDHETVTDTVAVTVR